MSGTSMLNSPLKSEMVAIFVPFRLMVAPIISSPSLLTTFPFSTLLTDLPVCEKSTLLIMMFPPLMEYTS